MHVQSNGGWLVGWLGGGLGGWVAGWPDGRKPPPLLACAAQVDSKRSNVCPICSPTMQTIVTGVGHVVLCESKSI